MAMMIMCGLLICSFILLFYVEAAAIASATSADSFFRSVDPEKRDLLVEHYLTEALERVSVRVIPDPRVADPISVFGVPPGNFSENLLSWTRSMSQLSFIQIGSRVANGEVNTDETHCTYPPDIGCHCCPF